MPDIDGIQEVMFKTGLAGNTVKLFSPTIPIWELKRHPMIEDWIEYINANQANYGCYETISKAKQRPFVKADGENYKR